MSTAWRSRAVVRHTFAGRNFLPRQRKTFISTFQPIDLTASANSQAPDEGTSSPFDPIASARGRKYVKNLDPDVIQADRPSHNGDSVRATGSTENTPPVDTADLRVQCERDYDLNVLQNGIQITVKPQGRHRVVDFIELRDGCKCRRCVDPSSTQRNFQTSDIPLNIVPRQMLRRRDELKVLWTNDIAGFDETHESFYSIADLEMPRPTVPYYRRATESDIQGNVWDRERMTKINRWHSYSDFMTSDKELALVIQRITSYGLAFLSDVPDKKETVGTIAERIGGIKETFYGPTWDVKSVPKATNVAYTSQFLGFHMDLLYMNDPPGIQLLHCYKNTCSGGESMFADALRAAYLIRDNNPNEFRTLATFPVNFSYANAGKHYSAIRPTFEIERVDRKPTIRYINWSPPFQGVLEHAHFPYWRGHSPNLGQDGADRWLRRFIVASRIFSQELELEKNIYELKMEPGQCVLFDNRRVVHARKGFNEMSGERWLRGAYVDWQDMKSTHHQIDISIRRGAEKELLDIGRSAGSNKIETTITSTRGVSAGEEERDYAWRSVKAASSGVSGSGFQNDSGHRPSVPKNSSGSRHETRLLSSLASSQVRESYTDESDSWTTAPLLSHSTSAKSINQNNTKLTAGTTPTSDTLGVLPTPLHSYSPNSSTPPILNSFNNESVASTVDGETRNISYIIRKISSEWKGNPMHRNFTRGPRYILPNVVHGTLADTITKETERASAKHEKSKQKGYAVMLPTADSEDLPLSPVTAEINLNQSKSGSWRTIMEINRQESKELKKSENPKKSKKPKSEPVHVDLKNLGATKLRIRRIVLTKPKTPKKSSEPHQLKETERQTVPELQPLPATSTSRSEAMPPEPITEAVLDEARKLDYAIVSRARRRSMDPVQQSEPEILPYDDVGLRDFEKRILSRLAAREQAANDGLVVPEIEGG